MKRLTLKIVVAVLLFCWNITSLYAQNYSPSWESLDTRPTPEWYGNAKFGIFLHWGIYSVPAWATNAYPKLFGSEYAEWYWERLRNKNSPVHREFQEFHDSVYGKNFIYQDFAPYFKTEMFEPDEWAKIFKNSGAKYVVLTSKHHDGFCLWPAVDAWNWNAKDIGPKKDLAGMLTKAVKNAGLKMGFYYSLYEWYNPLMRNMNQYVEQHMLPQMKQLVDNYSPDILWPDGEWDYADTVWRSQEFLAWLYNNPKVKDSIIVNDRWGSNTKGKHGSFSTSEYGLGNVTAGRPWEETRGIGNSFGYNRNENLTDYQSSKELIHELIQIVSNGGNLLLNLGPTADGRIPVIMQQRLQEMGNWLQVNGEAIYNTRSGADLKTINADKTIFFTRSNKNVYAILTKWQNKVTVTLNQQPKQVTLLGYNKPLQYRYTNGSLTVILPNLTPDINPSNDAWSVKIVTE